MKLTRNFSEKELQCPCCEECEMSPVLLTRLQALRDIIGPINITSGFRCEEQNKKVNGSEDSQHLKGNAVDIKISHMTSEDRYELINTSFSLGFSGVGIGKNHFHVDVRLGEKKSWGY